MWVRCQKCNSGEKQIKFSAPVKLVVYWGGAGRQVLIVKDVVLGSQCCHNTDPRTAWLKTTEIYSPIVWGWKSEIKVLSGPCSLRILEGRALLFLLAPGSLRQHNFNLLFIFTYLHLCVCMSLYLHMTFSLCVIWLPFL